MNQDKAKLIAAAFGLPLLAAGVFSGAVHYAFADEAATSPWLPPELTRMLSKGAIRAVSIRDKFKAAVGVGDDEVIMLPNENIVYVRDYLAALEDLQKKLAAEGLSLLGDGANLGKVAETISPKEVLGTQGPAILAAIRKIDPSYMPREFTREEMERIAKEAAKKELQASAEKLFRKAVAASGVEPPAFDPIPVPSFQARNDLKTRTHKDWSAAYGKPSTFLAEADAFFDLAGDVNTTQAQVYAGAKVRIFDSFEQKLLEAKGLVIAPKSGKIQGSGSLWMAGKMLFQEEFDTTVLDKTFKFEREAINVNTKLRWMVGPIPMSGKLGVSGKAGVDVNYRASLLNASASVTPRISGDGYAEVAVDAEVAAAGAGGELKVIEAQTKLTGLAGFAFNDSGVPQLTAKVDSQASLELLSGRLYSFVEAMVPWPNFKKRWERDIYAWDGIRKDLGHTVAFEKKTTPTSIALSGDAEAEDSIATDLDKYERGRVEELVKRSDELANTFVASETQTKTMLASVESGALKSFWARFQQP